jgi:hypothetical protein
MRLIHVWFTCPGCTHEFEVGVSPFVPARLYGPPENCSPAEGGEVQEIYCPNCDREFDDYDLETIQERASEKEDYYDES